MQKNTFYFSVCKREQEKQQVHKVFHSEIHWRLHPYSHQQRFVRNTRFDVDATVNIIETFSLVEKRQLKHTKNHTLFKMVESIGYFAERISIPTKIGVIEKKHQIPSYRQR